ncbi:hypothetical protein L596_030568 [Steinernema carpocapsae]|uniref:Uncharacterized protein n=1 Tax=Steinernema carpocapsae TaxID=34508 RepID=A0A4U5LPT8_STECR|nr:hypothetical protein L596_030568 [Steinernema carpocapsae]
MVIWIVAFCLAAPIHAVDKKQITETKWGKYEPDSGVDEINLLKNAAQSHPDFYNEQSTEKKEIKETKYGKYEPMQEGIDYFKWINQLGLYDQKKFKPAAYKRNEIKPTKVEKYDPEPNQDETDHFLGMNRPEYFPWFYYNMPEGWLLNKEHKPTMYPGDGETSWRFFYDRKEIRSPFPEVVDESWPRKPIYEPMPRYTLDDTNWLKKDAGKAP